MTFMLVHPLGWRLAKVREKLDDLSVTSRPVRFRQGVPVYEYDPAPHVPPVTVVRFDPAGHPPGDGRRHIHDFPVLILAADEVLLARPGHVIDPAGIEVHGEVVSVVFDPSSFSAEVLAPFHEDEAVARIPIDGRERFWVDTIAAMERELTSRDDGFREAVQAYASLLLIELRRTVEVDHVDPALRRVFDVIETEFRRDLSLRDVAARVGLSRGYLTTLVRQRTGRTVQQWITERRLAEARKLLAETSKPVSIVGRDVGWPDPAYFARVFTRGVGMSPRQWRLTRL
jgi:AraC-like DNA-binding protein